MTEPYVCKECGGKLRVEVLVFGTGYYRVDPKAGIETNNLEFYDESFMEADESQPEVYCKHCCIVGPTTGWKVKADKMGRHFLVEAQTETTKTSQNPGF